jgi:carbon storage regulator
MLSKTPRFPVAPVSRPELASRASIEGVVQPRPSEDEPIAKKLGGLVLTRRPGESIMIGEAIEVQVVGMKSATVRIKIVAPRSIPVHRREVFDAIQANPVVMAVSETKPEAVPPGPGKPQGGLVLTRSADQSIMIGEDVEIMIVEVRPTVVKLKIAAPRTVAVHRREVFDAIRGGQD